jgi:hypothetical protein
VTLVEDVECSEGQYKLRIDFGYESSSCWFHLSEKKEGSKIEANSFSFELSPSGPAQTTFGIEEPTETASETSSAPAATTTETTTTSEAADSEPAESDASSGDSGLSSGAKVGIGVGVGLGVLGIVSLVVAFWLVRRKRRRDEGGSPEERQELDGGGMASEIKYAHMYHKDTPQAPPSELMDTSAQRDSHVELPG